MNLMSLVIRGRCGGQSDTKRVLETTMNLNNKVNYISNQNSIRLSKHKPTTNGSTYLFVNTITVLFSFFYVSFVLTIYHLPSETE